MDNIKNKSIILATIIITTFTLTLSMAGTAAGATHDITVKIDNVAGDNIKGATVDLWRLPDGGGPPVFVGENVTDENGVVGFKDIEQDNYLYNVGKENYADNLGFVELTGDSTVNVTLKDADHKVTFNVVDNESTPIENAMIALVENTGEDNPAPIAFKRTDKNGKAVFGVFSDNYQYGVGKEGYAENEGFIEVDNNLTENVTLEKHFTFIVENADGNPIENVTVVLADNEGPIMPVNPEFSDLPFGVTGKNGWVYYYNENIGTDNYTYFVGKAGYEHVYMENVEFLNDNENIAVTMKEPNNPQDATFTVENEAGDPIESAGVLIGIDMTPENQKDSNIFIYVGDLTLTDSSGQVTFENLEPENYGYMGMKKGYKDNFGSFEIANKPVTENITLKKANNVKFNVQNNAGENIVGATVDLWGVGTRKTDENGVVVFKDVAEDNYGYHIKKDKYVSLENEVVVDSNVVVNVELESAPYTIAFDVVDENENPIENAGVSVSRKVSDHDYEHYDYRQTDSNGSVLFWVPSDNYRCYVDKDGYFGTGEEIEVVEENLTENITLRTVDHTLTFAVENESENPIKNAFVSLLDSLENENYLTGGETDENGKVEIGVPEDNYAYRVHHESYAYTMGEVEANESKTENVTLKKVLFEVRIGNYDNEVPEGENLEVWIHIYNRGVDEDTQNIELLDFNDNVVDSEEITLEPENGQSVNLTWETEAGDNGTDNIMIRSDDDNKTVEVTVREPVPAEFKISNLVVSPRSAEPGKMVEISADVANIGDETGENVVEFLVDGEVEDNENVKLEGRESKTVKFGTSRDNSGEYGIEIRVENDSENGIFTVGYIPEIDLSPVDNFENINVTYSLVVRNDNNSDNAIENVTIVPPASFDNYVAYSTVENWSGIETDNYIVFSTDNDPIENGDNLLFEFNCKTHIPTEDTLIDEHNVYTWTIKTKDNDNLTLTQYYNTRVFSEWYTHEGYTFDLEGNIVENAKVRVEVEHTHPNRFPPINDDEAEDIFTYHYAHSDKNGYFKVENIPSSGVKFRTRVTKFNEENHLTRMSWRPIDLSSSMFDNLDNVNYYMENGVTVNLDIKQDNQFNYRVWDRSTGYRIILVKEFVDNATFYLPANRDYKILVHREKTAGEISYVLDNIKENTSWQENQTINLEFNANTDVKSFSGHVEKPSGDDNFDNLAMLSYQFLKDSAIITYPEDVDWGVPASMGTDNFVPENGYYEVNLPSTAYGRDYLLFCTAYDKDENQYYGGFKQITLYNDNGQIELENLTLHPLLGDSVEYTLSSFEENKDTVTISTAMKRLLFEDSESERLENLSNINLRAKIDYSDLWNVESFWWKGAVSWDFPETFAYPIFENVGIKKLEVYSFDGMRKTSLSADRMSGENKVEVTLYPFNPRGIDDGQDFTDIKFKIYRNEPQYNVPNPDSSGLLWSAGGSNFNPWTVMLGGGDISFRIIKENDNIAVQYNNVNLLRSGPPDALFNTTPDDVTVNGSLAKAWKFGTMGPDIYDNILIGIPYNESEYSDSDDFAIRIGEFYDDHWNVIWDIKEDTVSELPDEYTTYKNEPYRRYIDNDKDPILASKTDPTSIAYVNTDNNMIWMRIPHFSGVQPTIIPQTTPTEEEPTQPDQDTKTEPTNEPPTAELGGPYTVEEGKTIQLDGTQSTDSDGTIANYLWEIINDPTGEATITDEDTSTPTFQAPAVEENETVTLRLTVTDNNNATDTTTTYVVIQPISQVKTSIEIENMPAENATKRLVETNIENAAKLLNQVSSQKAGEIINEAVDTGKTIKIGQILTRMSSEKAAVAVIEASSKSATSVMESIIGENIDSAALITDKAAKQNLEKIGLIVENIKTVPLSQLLIKIYDLPHTPEIAGNILSTISTDKGLEVTVVLLEDNKYEYVAGMFEQLSGEKLNFIWNNLTESEKSTLSQYLTKSTENQLVVEEKELPWASLAVIAVIIIAVSILVSWRYEGSKKKRGL